MTLGKWLFSLSQLPSLKNHCQFTMELRREALKLYYQLLKAQRIAFQGDIAIIKGNLTLFL